MIKYLTRLKTALHLSSAIQTLTRFSKLNVSNSSKLFFNQAKASFATSSSSSSNTNGRAINSNILSGANAAYLENQFESWLADKSSVSPSMNDYFNTFLYDTFRIQVDQTQQQQQQQNYYAQRRMETQYEHRGSQDLLEGDPLQILKINSMVNAYQAIGLEIADLDPIKGEYGEMQYGKHLTHKGVELLNHTYFGFHDEDLDKTFKLYSNKHKGLLSLNKVWTLRELIETLKKIYCNKIGYDYRHIPDHEIQNFLKEKIENLDTLEPSKEQKLKTFERLINIHVFSTFFNTKFKTSKRFGIEGCDAAISGLGYLVELAAQDKVAHIVLGMPHRGRLETLYSVFKKSSAEISAEFQEVKSGQTTISEDWGNSGDVKYHLGTQSDQVFPNGHQMRLQILHNPSHLEAVNPLVYGKVRAIQDFIKDNDRKKAIGVLMHGDASFAGQGIVYETLQFQDLYKYKSGGVIHIVVNNQIGFTTTPMESRSSQFCTEVAKCINAPIFHVNADEPDKVDQVMKLAYEFRQKFKKDVVIDVIGYRRFGHNELDQPTFTQPVMYQNIQKMPPVYEKYSTELIKQGVIDEHLRKMMFDGFMKSHQENYELTKSQKIDPSKWIPQPREQIMTPLLHGKIKDTGVVLDTLKTIASKVHTIPKDFNLHKQIEKIYETRLKSVLDGDGIDFPTGEALAFASLLYEGYGVRLSGQDVERGTFSQRHAVLNDQRGSRKYNPISNILDSEEQYKFAVCNSSLSEYGVLGFEYGYSLDNPNILCCWEAQFGDFANGAQVMIDNYIVSAESKWGVQSGITVLLPHGMDGQGPEHSSGRIERYLQLSDDDINIAMAKWKQGQIKKQIQESNIQVIVCSTPSQYFHFLRSQMRKMFRKPAFLFNSKRLQRYKGATSSLKDFGPGLRFKKIIPEAHPTEIDAPDQIQKVVICSGQVYYDILEKRRALKKKDVAIIRIEQIAPFPYQILKFELDKYKFASFIFAQEEHQNYGAWQFVEPRINAVLSKMREERQMKFSRVNYIGRKTSSSPATGSSKIHNLELDQLLGKIFV